MKHRGMGRVFQRGETWCVDYYCNGHRIRRRLQGASAASEALSELKRIQSEMHQRQHIPREDKLAWCDLVEMIVNEYQLKQRRSTETMKGRVAHLEAFFKHHRAINIDAQAVQRYQLQRVEQKASPATINRETSCLHHMLVLAHRMGKLSRVPHFEKLSGERVREGFLSFSDFDAILSKLAGTWRKQFIEWAFLTGWRVGKIRALEWKQVFLNDDPPWIKAGESTSTKHSPGDLPLSGRLLQLLQERAAARRLDCNLVFHHQGQRVGDLRKAWGTACKLAGFGHVLLHDFRRSIARNLTSSGVSVPVIMARCGWKTMSTFLRYRITDLKDQADANAVIDQAREMAVSNVEKLAERGSQANGKV